MKYTVKVVREDDAWVADVVGLAGAHTYARNLTSLDANVREVIALVEDLEDGAEPGLDVSYEYSNVSPLFVQAVAIGEERRELEARQADLLERMGVIAPKLVAAGESMRDIAAALQMSPGRVSQITSDSRVVVQAAPGIDIPKVTTVGSGGSGEFVIRAAHGRVKATRRKVT